MAKLGIAGEVCDIQAVLLDKDGTILDFVYTWGRWGELLLARFSEKLTARQLKKLGDDMLAGWGIRYDAQGEMSGYDRNGPLSMGTLEELLTLLTWEGYRRGLSWAETKRLAEQCRQEADAQLEQEKAVRLLPGVLDFLEACRGAGIRLGLVTSDETSAAVKHLDWLGVGSYFSVCIGADRVSRSKPFPDMVLEACSRMDIAPGNALVIGDTNGDMMMAKAAGAWAVGLDLHIINDDKAGLLIRENRDKRSEGSKESFEASDGVIGSYLDIDWIWDGKKK